MSSALLTRSTAASIALALADDVLGEVVDVDERLPSHVELATEHKVAVATAAAAVAMVRAAGLARAVPGSGTYAAIDPASPVVALHLAWRVCEVLAAAAIEPGEGPPVVMVRGVTVHCAALVALDRDVLRALGSAFRGGLERLVVQGPGALDVALIGAARSILQRGGVR